MKAKSLILNTKSHNNFIWSDKYFKRLILLGLFFYFIINLFSLMAFPLFHSDEIWLKGLSLEVWQSKNFGLTEPFYDLYPRVPHPFRWVFNLLQIGFIRLFGNTLFSVRLLSLVASTGGLYVFAKLIGHQTKSKVFTLLGLTMMILNLQWLYAAHFARQEALILLLMLIGYGLSLKLKSPYVLSALLLVAIGIHPNSFLMGCLLFTIMVYQVIVGQRPFKAVIQFVLSSLIGVFFYLLLGFQMASDFLVRYFSFGASLGVDALPMSRLQNYYWFWVKLYHQIGGTYELFDIRFMLILMATLLVISTLYFLKKAIKAKGLSNISLVVEPFLAILSLLLGLFIIGRNNQTSVIFFFPFIILLLLSWLSNIKRNQWLSLLVIPLILFSFYCDLKDYQQGFDYRADYSGVQGEILKHIPSDANILGNIINMEGFNPHHYYDIRNLAYLEDKDLTLEAYLKERNIHYIILNDEMDYIYQTSPKWDFLYVNMDYWPALETYINVHTTLVAEVDNPLYAMRISKYSGTYPWKTKIYRVLP